MKNYYADSLNSQKLFQVYETKIPRIKQYLQAEVDFVKTKLSKTQKVLEIGAGYGRIVKELAPHCKSIVGIDISSESIKFSKEYLKDFFNTDMIVMDVHKIEFISAFDVVLCLQNGLSAMKINNITIRNILKALVPGGKAYFSSYSSKFWATRLKWFEEQSSKGLLGEIDYNKTRDGIIICKDGFKAITHSPEDLQSIAEELGCVYKIQEVDESSIFLIVNV